MLQATPAFQNIVAAAICSTVETKSFLITATMMLTHSNIHGSNMGFSPDLQFSVTISMTGIVCHTSQHTGNSQAG